MNVRQLEDNRGNRGTDRMESTEGIEEIEGTVWRNINKQLKWIAYYCAKKTAWKSIRTFTLQFYATYWCPKMASNDRRKFRFFWSNQKINFLTYSNILNFATYLKGKSKPPSVFLRLDYHTDFSWLLWRPKSKHARDVAITFNIEISCLAFCFVKGHLISKWFLGPSISSKKRTNELDFTAMIRENDLFLFIFWRKSTTPTNHF